MKLVFNKNGKIELVPTTKKEKYIYKEFIFSKRYPNRLNPYGTYGVLYDIINDDISYAKGSTLFIFNNPFNYVNTIKDYNKHEEELDRLAEYCDIYEYSFDRKSHDGDIKKALAFDKTFHPDSFCLMCLVYTVSLYYNPRSNRNKAYNKLAKKLARIKKLYEKSKRLEKSNG